MVSLSIIIPTYNNLKLLKRCIQSIEKQIDLDDEVLIIDDGSQDETFNYLINNYSNNNNYFIKKQINAGAGSARNNGIFTSRKEYIWFIDSDDYIEETSIKKVKETLDKEKYDLLYFDYKIKTNQGVELHKLHLKSLTSREVLLTQHFPWNKIIKRELMNDVSFPSEKICFEDQATIPVVIAKANKIGYLSEGLYVYDFSHESNSSKNNQKANDMYTACDYLIEYSQKGNLSSEELEVLLIKSLIFYKLFDQSNTDFKEITKDLIKIREYLNLNAPNWMNSEYLSFKSKKNYAHLISNISLKIFVAVIFKRSTILTSLIIYFVMKIKQLKSNVNVVIARG